MRIPSLHPRLRAKSLLRDRRGIAATEFALIAPVLIFLIMGVFEMAFRFRASEEATRYVHQVADLISRETGLTTDGLDEIYDASIHMMKPLDTVDNLDVDVSSVAFVGDTATPTVYWRRVAGAAVPFDLSDTEGMGVKNESVIRVGIRYNYQSVITSLFGGGFTAIERNAYSRPRVERMVTLDGQTDDGGTIEYFGG
jgi:Flp pilus assembly protein TadG